MDLTQHVQPAYSVPRNRDDLDLLDLLGKIWAGRKTIAIIVLLSAICAFIALKLTPSYYRIEATIDAVPADQLRALYPSILEGKEYQVPLPNEKKIFTNVLLQIGSLSSLRAFWEAKTGKMLPNNEKEIKSEADSLNLAQFKKFVGRFYLEPSNPKLVDITARKISIEHVDRLQGVALLGEYLEFSRQQVLLEQIKQLELSFQASLKSLDINYTNKVKIEEQELNDSLITLRENLKIANSLGIRETPFKELENIQLKVLDGQGYLLGAKTITQQIEILSARQGKSLAPFSVELRNMENWRMQIESDRERIHGLVGQLQLFSVINQPEATFDPIRPNKLWILIGIVFAAGILSIFIVLIQSVLGERKAEGKV